MYSEKVLPQIFQDDEDILSMMPGQFRKDKYEIKLGSKAIDFELSDNIFKLQGPIGQKI